MGPRTLDEILDSFDHRLLESPAGRRALCEDDPILFALIYLKHTITDADGSVSFADCHFEWADIAKRWMTANPPEDPYANRWALLAPRETGKSTWWLKILPLWWMAYGYEKFIVVFAKSDEQAQRWLGNYRHELDTNKLLQSDFPTLCTPGRRPSGMAAGDAKGIRVSKNGGVYLAKGLGSQALGMNVHDKRPGTILLDDAEADESSYSIYQAGQQLKNLQQAIFPLNYKANVVLSGTVTMAGSIMHQIVKYNKGYRTKELDWVREEGIKVHHALPILTDSDGIERSQWAEKWSMKWLTEQRHTRSFQLNYWNDPSAIDSEYWRMSDFRYDVGDIVCTNSLLSIDGAVTTGKKSDFTGLAVVGYAPKTSEDEKFGKCVVKYADGVKLQGEPLRDRVLRILDMFPEIRGILAESNQGGDMWYQVLHDMPVPVILLHNKEKKEYRAAKALEYYQYPPGYVYHAAQFAGLEEQMCNFPAVVNDDILDAVVNGVLTYMAPKKAPKAGIRGRY